MSLILDALRKADAERERGAVPSLHAQPVVPRSVDAPPAPRQRPTWPWVAIGAAAGLTLAAAWVMLGRDAPAVAPAPRSDPAPMSAPPAATAPAARSPVAVAPTATQPVAEPAPWPQREEPKAAPVPTLTAPGVPTLTAPNVAPVVSREQLPPNIRAELPQFAIGGSMYSSNPASRSLIVNGQLYRERDRLTADLTLEEIRQKAAIFSYRGHRFEVVF